jgi:hypothetical protein
MKWFLFFLIGICLLSCKNKVKPKESTTTEPEQVRYNDTVKMPWLGDSEIDTGYFKGKIPEKLDNLEQKDTTLLFKFLSGLISTKDISLLTDETLSHSVLIDQINKVRFDTLRNKKFVITSVFHFGKKETQTITINGNLLKGYRDTQDGLLEDDVFDFDEASFRHFSFHGKEFFYIRAGSMYSFGSSMGNVNYNLVYSIAQKRLNCFQTCRFYQMLFGDANGDEDLDCLDFNNSDFCYGVPLSDSVIIQLYSCNKKGDFVLQKDPKGKSYFIDGNTGNSFYQDSFIVKRYYWPKPLK